MEVRNWDVLTLLTDAQEVRKSAAHKGTIERMRCIITGGWLWLLLALLTIVFTWHVRK
jgi:hypothetical protein